tara:strand:+ start:1988 stop:2776 length:789 start_codon:yes stop_codon:yes gene_type:complete
MNVALFGYNRPEHTRKTLEALKQSFYDGGVIHLECYLDGTDAENQAVNDVILEYMDMPFTFNINRAGERRELRTAVEEGLDDFFGKFDRGIVLEDDIVVSPYFVEFMRNSLYLYEEDENIFSICSFMQPSLAGPADTVLLPRTHSWGWATWADKWKLYDPDLDLQAIKDLGKNFNCGHLNLVEACLDRPQWAVRWYYTQYKHHGLSLFPTKSLSINIGMDRTGYNCDPRNPKHSYCDEPIPLIYKDTIDLKLYAEYLRTNRW